MKRRVSCNKRMNRSIAWQECLSRGSEIALLFPIIACGGRVMTEESAGSYNSFCGQRACRLIVIVSVAVKWRLKSDRSCGFGPYAIYQIFQCLLCG